MLKISIKMLFMLIICSLFLSSQVFANNQNEKENEAIKSAVDYLGLVDTGQYDKSWDEASMFFKSQISQTQWAEKLSSLRPLFGKVINRTIINTKYLTSAPGAPDGEYVIVVFQTSFENKKSAIEQVTPMLEKDGKWRVTGYFIK